MDATASIPTQAHAYYIDALIGESRWAQNDNSPLELTYSFTFAHYDQTVFYHYMPNNETAYDLSGLMGAQQEAARLALQKWAAVANMDFTEVIDNPGTEGERPSYGDIRFTYLNGGMDSSTWGYAYYPGSNLGGDIWISADNAYTYLGEPRQFAEGSYDFLALLHEIGHALGLDHSFEGSSPLPGPEDNYRYTLMSYTSTNAWHLEETESGLIQREVFAAGPSLYDIAAIQYLYGANMNYEAGDSSYEFDPQTPFLETLWDAGGEDTIHLEAFETDCIIDLRAGSFQASCSTLRQAIATSTAKSCLPTATPAKTTWQLPMALSLRTSRQAPVMTVFMVMQPATPSIAAAETTLSFHPREKTRLSVALVWIFFRLSPPLSMLSLSRQTATTA